MNALAFDPAPARCIEACLGVHAVIGLVYDHLDMALGLHGATHHTKGTNRAVSFREETGDYRVVRPFAGRDLIGMPWLQGETPPAVLERDPCARDDDAAAEPLVVRLDVRDHHAARICGAKI